MSQVSGNCPSAPHPSVLSDGGALSVVASSSLLQGQTTVLIEHQGVLYRLQATRQGKLILTK
jgi:hemin uptake protein HemP